MAESVFTKIPCAVDFFPCSEEAFRVALTLAKTFQVQLLWLHVIGTSALATFNQLGLLAVPSDAQVRSGGCVIMRSMCGNCSNQSRPGV
jgi:hypothetical protein